MTCFMLTKELLEDLSCTNVYTRLQECGMWYFMSLLKCHSLCKVYRYQLPITVHPVSYWCCWCSKVSFKQDFITAVCSNMYYTYSGVVGLLLTSSAESEGGQVFVCPNTNITFTCSDTQIFSLLWYARPLLNEDNTPGGLSIRRDPGYSIVVDDIFKLTVQSVENITGLRGDLTSTLNMVVNDQRRNYCYMHIKLRNDLYYHVEKRYIQAIYL